MTIPSSLFLLNRLHAAVFLALCLGGEAVAQGIKLVPRPADYVSSGRHGASVALNDRYAVVGQPGSNRRATSAGAVHVYAGGSGRFLRTLAPADLQPFQEFGVRLTLSGHTLLVSSGSAVPQERSVYAFDLRTGRLLHKLSSPAGSMGNEFGSSLALAPDRAFVGARAENSFDGAVHEFDLATGELIATLQASNPTGSDRLGTSLAVAGDVLFAGAPGWSSGRGAVFLFNWRNKYEIGEITSSTLEPGDQLGTSVAVAGDRLYAGAPQAQNTKGGVFAFNWIEGVQTHSAFGSSVLETLGSSLAASRELVITGGGFGPDQSGRTVLFDGATLTSLQTTTGAFFGENYGRAVATFGNRLLVGAPTHDPEEVGSYFGMAYLLKAPVSGTLPLTAVMVPGESADGGGSFRVVGDGFINDVGAVIAGATLRGATPRSSNAGIWSDAGSLGTPSLMARKGFDVTGDAFGTSPRSTRVDWPLMNRPGHALVRAQFPGGREGLYRGGSGGALSPLLPSGAGYMLYGGSGFRKILDLAQSSFTPLVIGDLFGSYAIRFQLGTPSGGRIDPIRDSGILIADSGNTVDSVSQFINVSALEGSPAPGGGNIFGEMGPRVAHTWRQAAFSTSVTGPLGTRQALVRINVPSNTQHLVADAAVEEAPGLEGSFFRVFTGVGIQTDLLSEWAIWRATIKGSGFSKRFTEGVWHEEYGLSLVNNFPVDQNNPNIVWKRVLGVWPAGPEGRMVVLAGIKGPGITKANDVGIWLLEVGQAIPLLREGQGVTLPDSPRIRTIHRVDVAANGRYGILASLTGASTRNLTLLTGHVDPNIDFLDSGQILAQPALRKGSQMNHTAFGTGPIAIRSLALPKTTDPGGMGGRGRGQVINHAGALTIKIRAGGKEILMSGKP